MGGKSKTQTSQQTSSTTPPDWVTSAYQNLFRSAQDTAGKEYQSYGGQRVAGLSPEQEAGIAATTAAVGKSDPYYGKASGYLDQSAQAITPMAFSGEALQQFLNPYQKDVIDATMAQTAENDRRQQQDLTGKAIMSGAWGGDRAGVAKAELARQQKMAADSTLAGLNSQNFSQALQAFQQQQGVDLSARQSDAQRQASAGSQFMNLGQSAQDSALKDAYAQIQAGGVRQQNEQAKADAAYEDWLAEQAYPFQSQSWLANILGGIGSGAGSTTSGTSYQKGSGGSNAGSYLGAGISLASALFSDERLKEDIEQVGETFDGQPIYRYRFKGSPKTQIGLMAQDVEDAHPDAVGNFGGVKMVDYERATDDAAREGFADGGVPYSGRVKSRIPDTSPMKFRAGLMGSNAATPSASGMRDDSDRTDYGKMGSQVGGLLKGFGGSGAMDISPVGFSSSGVGSVADAFSGDLGGFGLVYARGGAVPDMEEGPDGVFRVARAWGGDVPYAETEEDAQRLERELGMVTDEPRKPMFFGRDTGYVESKPVVPVSGLSGVDPDLAARVSALVGASEGNLPGVRSGFRSTEEQSALRDRYLRGEGPLAAPPGSSRHETGNAVDIALAGAPGTPRRDEAVAFIDRVAPAWGLRQTVASEPWHLEVDPNWQGPIQGRANFGDSATMVAAARPQARSGLGDVARAATELNGVMSRLDRPQAQATAFAPNEDGTASRTSAFDAVKPTGILPLNDRAPATAEAAADPNKGFGLGYLPKDVQMALIAAGLGMMGSRGHSAGQQIGEGGLAGLQFYLNAQQAKAKTAADERDRQRKILTEDRAFNLEERKHKDSLLDKARGLMKGEIREVNGRLVSVNPYTGATTDVTPAGMPSGVRPMTDEERASFRVSKDAGAYVDASGKPVVLSGGASSNKILTDIEERKAAAASIGLKPNDPRYETYILTGKTPREDAQPLSATDKKAILEADEGVLAAETAIGALKEAKQLSKKAYEGPTASLRGKVTGIFGSEEGLATSELNNLVMTNALSQLKAIFGAAPTEGERKLLLEIQGAAEQPDALRQKLFDRAIAMAEKRLAFNRQRAEEMRGGSFFKKPEGGKGEAGAVKTVTSKAEYDKLPSGTQFAAPDGSVRVKP